MIFYLPETVLTEVVHWYEIETLFPFSHIYIFYLVPTARLRKGLQQSGQILFRMFLLFVLPADILSFIPFLFLTVFFSAVSVFLSYSNFLFQY